MLLLTLQVHDSLEDTSSPAQDITWGTKAAALLSCIATWVLYHVGLPILAMIIDGIILSLAVMYCTLKAVLCYYLPRCALSMVSRLIGLLWAVTAGWAVVIGCAVGGSPCTVVGTHKLHTRTEHEQQVWCMSADKTRHDWWLHSEQRLMCGTILYCPAPLAAAKQCDQCCLTAWATVWV